MRAALVTLVSVVASYVLTTASFVISPVEPDRLWEVLVPAFVIATIVPTLVAFPVSIILQIQQLKVSDVLAELKLAHAQLAYNSRIDHLTSVLNRDAFLTDLSGLQEMGLNGAMLMIDVDHFKSVNDSFGHQAGDEALALVAGVIKASVRASDLVGRLGGEEFGVFLHRADLSLATHIAERIRVGISDIRFTPRTGVKHRITASIGVAIGDQETHMDDLIRIADHCLYKSKGAGRNRVTAGDTEWRLMASVLPGKDVFHADTKDAGNTERALQRG